jgi:hypothetical protein
MRTRGRFPDCFHEESEIGLRIVEPQCFGSVAVHDAVERDVAGLIAAVGAVSLMPAANPEVVGPRGIS